MLRRLSDVTIGSIEKFLNIGGKESSEKKRKFIISEGESEGEVVDNVADKEVIRGSSLIYVCMCNIVIESWIRNEEIKRILGFINRSSLY